MPKVSFIESHKNLMLPFDTWQNDDSSGSETFSVTLISIMCININFFYFWIFASFSVFFSSPSVGISFEQSAALHDIMDDWSSIITFVVDQTLPSRVRVLDEPPGLWLGQPVPQVGQHLHHVSCVNIAVLVIIKYPQSYLLSQCSRLDVIFTWKRTRGLS